ncbi:YsaB family lipoprotein [Citrobacter freundii]|uniref:YsaB family lipoprotein n=1 Tax=unclassified Citrobacter TaxID=2644389 RepID=UPI0005EDBF76|nr:MULTISPECIES: YsaB family lipoprotein [Citrobacter]MCQ7057537.1 YsaB family lipoprotein [Escherichia coli]MBJ9599369.1 YsaB family lipoprotein [Citrobacter werkmanii]MBJ9872751.1 YsaB family lipoprotein [Citrobacter werkmanii]MDK2360654.1 YsaB family lipoprotein [Citrobacter freundii]MDM2927705.1 YsaB family lipoprotein [Citrobacter sp. Cm046]
MMMKYFFPVMVTTFLLAGCADPQSSAAEQKAQKVKVTPTRSLDMESLCKNEAAERYNTATQKIDVTGFEQFQGSYEMRGSTFRKESFVCSFDADGQFLHLSMR